MSGSATTASRGPNSSGGRGCHPNSPHPPGPRPPPSTGAERAPSGTARSRLRYVSYAPPLAWPPTCSIAYIVAWRSPGQFVSPYSSNYFTARLALTAAVGNGHVTRSPATLNVQRVRWAKLVPSCLVWLATCPSTEAKSTQYRSTRCVDSKVWLGYKNPSAAGGTRCLDPSCAEGPTRE